MGRKKEISTDSILDAAEQVIGQSGVARLTIEAVAAQAKISKASVLYVHKTKQALLEALVTRAMQRDDGIHREAELRLDKNDSVALRGRIEVAKTPPPEEFRPIALNLSSALILNTELRRTMQQHQSEVIERIITTSAYPRGALLAYLALEGFKFLDHLDFHKWSATERAQILAELNWLADQDVPVAAATGEKDD
ncbi:TetR/AcrR family transcriptional regulator [Winslowiella iniecta]|uniref:TetR family transcriptional regulator n=1 Tax=Winslowiella iniecta TaxID=1560201 RepID=A0A0L7T9P5_9GAMM|nr:TetR/AcrR family transcriptional regulator [Winslowiella iniecta]KOC91447.1 TetR family transcriptional regulator [Winslowiella iniecta]KOC92092.1 TetR family transcriptional regulator [Winslowiella iniecta]